METTHTPAGSGAGEGLDFTKSDGSGINKKPMRESDARVSEFEQKDTLSMNDSSTHGNGRVGQLNFLDITLLIGAKTPIEAAKAALKLQLRPVPLHAIGHKLKSGDGKIKIAQGKEPKGYGWHKKRWTIQDFESFYTEDKNRGIGLILGPDAGIIDIEIDQPKGVDAEEFRALADAELASLCGGEIPATAGWQSGRGRHRLFLWDKRLQSILDAGISSIHHGRLEIRFGAGKGAQSAIPPTKHAESIRQWLTDSAKVARLPDAAITNLLAAAENKIREKLGKRLIGQARTLADNIRKADKGDKDNGRHPTALISARTMAGFIEFYKRHDLTEQIKQILLIGYQDSKPELDKADGEFSRTIEEGWQDGLLEPFPLDDRPMDGETVVNGADQHNRVADMPAPAATDTTTTADELIAPSYTKWAENRAAMVWHWPGWIPSNQLVLVSGDFAAGKSTLLVYLLVLMTTGKPWPDGSPNNFETDKPVLYLDADNRSDLIGEAFIKAGGDPEKLRLATLPEDIGVPLFLDKGESFETLRKYVKGTKPGCLVVDTVARASDVDLTNPQQLSAFLKPLQAIAQEFGIVVFLLGHTNSDGKAYGRHIQAAVVSSWVVSHETMTGRRTLSCEFTRAARPDSISFEIGESGCHNFSVLTMPEGGTAIEQVKHAVLNRLQSSTQALSHSDLSKHLNELGVGSGATLTRALKELIDQKKIVTRPIQKRDGSGSFPVYQIEPENDPKKPF